MPDPTFPEFDDLTRLLTVPEVATALSCSKMTVRQRVSEGELKPSYITLRDSERPMVLFTVREVERYAKKVRADFEKRMQRYLGAA